MNKNQVNMRLTEGHKDMLDAYAFIGGRLTGSMAVQFLATALHEPEAELNFEYAEEAERQVNARLTDQDLFILRTRAEKVDISHPAYARAILVNTMTRIYAENQIVRVAIEQAIGACYMARYMGGIGL